MSDEQEILNIDHHVKILTLKALNKFCGSQPDAARAMGISEKTLIRYKRRFRIKREPGRISRYYAEPKIIEKLK